MGLIEASGWISINLPFKIAFLKKNVEKREKCWFFAFEENSKISLNCTFFHNLAHCVLVKQYQCGTASCQHTSVNIFFICSSSTYLSTYLLVQNNLYHRDSIRRHQQRNHIPGHRCLEPVFFGRHSNQIQCPARLLEEEKKGI